MPCCESSLCLNGLLLRTSRHVVAAFQSGPRCSQTHKHSSSSSCLAWYGALCSGSSTSLDQDRLGQSTSPPTEQLCCCQVHHQRPPPPPLPTSYITTHRESLLNTDGAAPLRTHHHAHSQTNTTQRALSRAPACTQTQAQIH